MHNSLHRKLMSKSGLLRCLVISSFVLSRKASSIWLNVTSSGGGSNPLFKYRAFICSLLRKRPRITSSNISSSNGLTK